MAEVRLPVTQRTEFGKGAARRARRDGQIPAVLYGHGSEPRHLHLPTIEFARVIRENGQNAVLNLDLQDGGEKIKELAFTKTVTIHPLKNYIQHVDLLVVRRGEKITVDVPIVLSGEASPGTLVNHGLDSLSIEVEALHIPEQFEVDIDGAEVGAQWMASDIQLPRGAELVTDPETLVVAVNEAPTESDLEEETEEEAAEGEAAEESAEGAEAEGGESEEASDSSGDGSDEGSE